MSKLHGAWIWYELMTTDVPGAKAFYEAVVGWTIHPGEQPPLFYGMIMNADGGATGGGVGVGGGKASGGGRHRRGHGAERGDDLGRRQAGVAGLYRGGRHRCRDQRDRGGRRQSADAEDDHSAGLAGHGRRLLRRAVLCDDARYAGRTDVGRTG